MKHPARNSQFLLSLILIGIACASCTRQKYPDNVVAEVRNGVDGSPVAGATVDLRLYTFGAFGIDGHSEIIRSARSDQQGNAAFTGLAEPASGTKYQLGVQQSLSFSGSKVLDIDNKEKIKLDVFPLLRKRLSVQAAANVKFYSLAVSCGNIFGQEMRTSIEGSSQHTFLFVTAQPNTVQVFRIFNDMSQKDTVFNISPAANDTSAIAIQI